MSLTMSGISCLVLLLCLVSFVCSTSLTKKPYNWVVVATFKNESTVLTSWIHHYINEGADHFYLIDNGSQDDYMSVLQSFPHQQMITVLRDSSPPRPSLQDILMKKYVTPLVVQEAQWVLVVDVDEYLYPVTPDQCVANVLESYPDTVGRIFLPWKVFGSNGHQIQPAEGIVAGFTKRKNSTYHTNANIMGFGKGLTRVRNSGLEMLTHTCGNGDTSIFLSNGTELLYGDAHAHVALYPEALQSQPLQLNHYMYQSRDYYQRTKCTRGGGQSGRSSKYTMAFYNEHEPRANVIEDEDLKERYKVLGTRCVSKNALLNHPNKPRA